MACTSPSPDSLRIGTNLWVGYDPLYLARSLGAYDDGSVRLVELPATTDVIHALRSRTLEAAALTLDEVIGLLVDGLDLRVVLVMDYSSGADAVVGAGTMRGLGDLRGRRIGYEESAVGALMLDAMLQAGGLSPNAITPVALTPDQHVSSFLHGKVDAVVTYEPALSALLEQGGKLLFDSSAIPGQIVDVLAVRGDVLEQHPEQVRSLVQGWFEALAQLERDPALALSRMALRHQLAGEELAASLSGLRFVGLEENRRLLIDSGNGLTTRAERLAQVMVQRGLLPRTPPLERIGDHRGLPE